MYISVNTQSKPSTELFTAFRDYLERRYHIELTPANRATCTRVKFQIVRKA